MSPPGTERLVAITFISCSSQPSRAPHPQRPIAVTRIPKSVVDLRLRIWPTSSTTAVLKWLVTIIIAVLRGRYTLLLLLLLLRAVDLPRRTLRSAQYGLQIAGLAVLALPAAVNASTVLTLRHESGDWYADIENPVALPAAVAGGGGFAACELHDEHVPIFGPGYLNPGQ